MLCETNISTKKAPLIFVFTEISAAAGLTSLTLFGIFGVGSLASNFLTVFFFLVTLNIFLKNSAGRNSAWGLLGAHCESQELLPGFGVLQVDSQHGAGHRAAVHLLDAAHHHAHVPAKPNKKKCQTWSRSISHASRRLVMQFGRGTPQIVPCPILFMSCYMLS